MHWELAHRRRDADAATHVTIEAQGSWDAVEALRAQIPGDELVLYVRTSV